jgi:hypothetical protein
MNANAIFTTQAFGSLVVFALVARWYWAPRMAGRSLADGLTPLLLLHVTRTIGLSMIVPTIVSPDVPREFAVPAAYGDFIAALLALLSIAALRTGFRYASILVWVFSVEGIADLGNAIFQGLRINLVAYQLGFAWLIFVVLVPALLVTHAMVVARLLGWPRAAQGR